MVGRRKSGSIYSITPPIPEEFDESVPKRSLLPPSPLHPFVVTIRVAKTEQTQMMARNDNSDFHVLVIGAGTVGLLIAQRLKILGVKCTVFEREHYLNERPRDWSFAIVWAQDRLTECLPSTLSSRLSTAFIDPLQVKNSGERMKLLNGKTGEELKVVPTPNLDLFKRSKFRALLAEGIDVQV